MTKHYIKNRILEVLKTHHSQPSLKMEKLSIKSIIFREMINSFDEKYTEAFVELLQEQLLDTNGPHFWINNKN